MNAKPLLFALPLLFPGLPALAWSTDSTTYDPSVQSQFFDPDEAVDNIGNPGSDRGTALSVQSNGTGGAHPVATAPDAADAEPVNPGWPMWMTWHRQ